MLEINRISTYRFATVILMYANQHIDLKVCIVIIFPHNMCYVLLIVKLPHIKSVIYIPTNVHSAIVL